MPRRISPRVRRSSRQWAIRGGLAAAAMAVGYFSVVHTLAQVVAFNNPALAHSLAPSDGRIAAKLAASLSGPDATSADRGRADTLARAALSDDALAVQAVSTLGIDAQLRGNSAQAQRLFAYSQKLSRRDLQTQLWAIEVAVARSDVAGALHHYDIALRTSTDSWELLFSVLGKATTNPVIRAALVSTLSQRPIWGASFIAYNAAHSPNPEATAALFTELRQVGLSIADGARAPIINALIERGALDQAWRYYATGRSNAVRNSSRDPYFTGRTEAASMLDWVAVDDGSIASSIQRGDAGGVFDFAAPASVGGALLRQVQLLLPGNYRITGLSSGIEQAADALPYWSLSCRKDDKELGRVVVPVSSQAQGRFEGRFVVPSGCPVQVLTLIARPSDAVGGVTGQIRRVQLVPAR